MTPDSRHTLKSVVELLTRFADVLVKVFGQGNSSMKMESKKQSKKVSVRESIKYVSNLITGLGVTGICPESLRLAKFNRVESSRCLLDSLRSIVILVTKSSDPSLASSSTSCDNWREHLAPKTIHAALESICEASRVEDTLRVVKFYLALWEYPSHSPFFTLHAGALESRHFLLALGWILWRFNLIKKGLERRLQPLLAVRSVALLPNNFPVDMSSGPEALARAKIAEWVALEYVQRTIAATDRVEDEVLRTEMRADQVLMLYGQVRACLNAIQALQTTKVKKMHELQLAQLVAGEKQSDTPYELHLLQHRKKLDLHCHAIAAAKAIEDEKEVCHKHEELFWQWMESVAREALAVQSPLEHHPIIDSIGVTEAEMDFYKGGKQVTAHGNTAAAYKINKLATVARNVQDETSSLYRLNVPTDAKTERAALPDCFKRNSSIVDSCPSGDSTLCKHGMDIGKCLLKHPVFVYKPIKKPEKRTVEATVRNEENVPRSASYRTQRLMDVDEMMKEILARTHAENQVLILHMLVRCPSAVILETLKPIMEDESCVVVGV